MRLHRWVALALGLWFALLGATGSVLAWHGELDAALNPEWFAPSACTATATPVTATLAVFARATGNATPTQVMAPAQPGGAYVVWEATDTGRRQHFIDPACGRYLGHRTWGAARIDRTHLVPALYELHRSLLSGEVGHVLVGLVGLLLLGVAITGLLTAWPRHSTRQAWRRTFTIKRGASTRRTFYDVHRASGTWLAAFLLLMSVTGAYLCFPKQGRALVAVVLPTQAAAAQAASPSGAAFAPDALVARAERQLADARWSRLQLPKPGEGNVEVRLLQPAEPRMDTGDTRVRLAADGRVLDVRDPLTAPSGDVVLAWLFPLHSGEAFGYFGRALWTLFGLAPPLLFATGLWLWLKRRAAQRRHAG